MREKGWGGGKYLIDGFPRSFDNLAAWEQMAGDQVLVKFVLYLDVCEQVMEARLLERGKTSGRADDNIESIRKRFLTFHQESRPVVERFQADGRVVRIDAEQHRDDVWRDVQALFGPSVVFVLGGPGSGKGTQCTKIAESFGYVHLSAGDLLREERAREGSEYGELINSYIKEGKLVPVEITIELIKQAMVKFGWEGGRYLIDGFPRSFDNLKGWEKVIGNSVRVKFVLFFDASEETMQVRLVERGKTSGRADDNLESIKKRFVTFQQESMPVVESYRLQGLVRRIDAEQSSEKVWSDVQRNFGPQVIFVLGGPGAGKGTQCARIAANFGFQHLSAGDLLREERKRPGSELGELIESHIKEGKLVPVSVVVRLLQKAMEERGWEDGKYLIDGFPRSAENMQGWNDMIGPKVDVKFCMFFDCSEAVMEARLLERGKTSGRSDDNLESIKKRFATYQQESLPVVERFSREGAMRRINAEQGLDEVWSCVQEVMHNERDGHLLNQALVLIKPSSFNKDTQRFVQSFFTTHKDCPKVSDSPWARPAGSLFRSSASLCATPVVLDLLDDFLGMARKEEAAGSMASLAQTLPLGALSLEGAVELVAAFCSSEWLTATLAGCLYRGEDSQQPSRLEPVPDLLQTATYGPSGADYFARLEAESTAAECWPPLRPLGRLAFAWPRKARCFWEEGRAAEFQEILINEGLEDAIRAGHEVLFQCDLGWISIPLDLEQDFLQCTRPCVGVAVVALLRALDCLSNEISIVEKGIVAAKDIADRNLFDKQYLQLARFATGIPDDFKVAAEAAARFESAFGVSFTAAAPLGAEAAAAKLGISTEEMFTLWQSSPSMKLDDYCYHSDDGDRDLTGLAGLSCATTAT
ncbi:cmpk, partial [Symbiodinium sp. KB8]